MDRVTAHSEAASQAAPEVSVVIPCLNEEKSIALCIDKARAALGSAGIRAEIVVADNGSTDRSVAIAEQHGARVVHVSRRGYGSALRKGIEESRGAFIVMGDADDSYDFAEIPRFVAKWREGYEFVMGNRFLGGIKDGAMPWHHKHIGTPALSALAKLFFRTGLGDVNCGMRGFTKELYSRMNLRTTGMEFASELLIKGIDSGARVTEIPVTLWPDKRGRPPHLRSFRDGWRHLRFMLLYAPNWLFLVPGFSLFMLGLGLVLWLLPGPRRVGHTTLDVHTMLFGMVFTLLGVQVITTGLFAKVFSYSERLTQNQRPLERWLQRVRLEEGLIVGLILFLIGASGTVWLFWKWAASDFGPFHEIRAVIFFSLWLFLGIQVVFSSFFLSMLGISRGTHTGDYELN